MRLAMATEETFASAKMGYGNLTAIMRSPA
jgi:hypothetical protein